MTARSSKLRRWLREPLAVFAALSAAVFLLHGATREPDPRTVVVPAGIRGDELEDWKLEEAAHREALSLGLGRDDTEVLSIVKQRLAVARSTPTPEPTDAELARFLELHRDAFELPERFDFDHVFFAGAGSGSRSRARAVLRTLDGDSPVPEAGDEFRFGNRLRSTSLTRVQSMFGAAFAEELKEAEPGRWQLLTSGEGVHVVRLLARHPKALPSVDDVRQALTDAWKRDREAAAELRVLRSLKDEFRFVDAP